MVIVQNKLTDEASVERYMQRGCEEMEKEFIRGLGNSYRILSRNCFRTSASLCFSSRAP